MEGVILSGITTYDNNGQSNILCRKILLYTKNYTKYRSKNLFFLIDILNFEDGYRNTGYIMFFLKKKCKSGKYRKLEGIFALQ